MISAIEYLLAAAQEGGWDLDSQTILLCRFIDRDHEQPAELGKFLQEQLDEESEMSGPGPDESAG